MAMNISFGMDRNDSLSLFCALPFCDLSEKELEEEGRKANGDRGPLALLSPVVANENTPPELFPFGRDVKDPTHYPPALDSDEVSLSVLGQGGCNMASRGLCHDPCRYMEHRGLLSVPGEQGGSDPQSTVPRNGGTGENFVSKKDPSSALEHGIRLPCCSGGVENQTTQVAVSL